MDKDQGCYFGEIRDLGYAYLIKTDPSVSVSVHISEPPFQDINGEMDAMAPVLQGKEYLEKCAVTEFTNTNLIVILVNSP